MRRALLILLLMLAARPLSARQAESCQMFAAIPGGSTGRDAISRCRLSNRPGLRSGLEGLPEPIYARSVRSDLSVVVDTTGQVVDGLTRYWTLSAFAGNFHDRLRTAILRWAFDPGMLNGESRQFAFRLQVVTEERRDEAPSRIEWSYREGGSRGDTLYGTWVPTGPPRPLSPKRRASAVRSVVRALARMNVLVEGPLLSRCLIYDGPDRQRVRNIVSEELNGDLRISLARDDRVVSCAEDVRFLRLMMSDFVLSGGERMVVKVGGDLLPGWPPGFDAAPARAWTGECVTPRSAERDERTLCNIVGVPGGPPAFTYGSAGLLPARPNSDPADLAFVARVTTSDAFAIDTLFGTVRRLPDLARSARVVRSPTTCEDGFSYRAEGPASSEGAVVLWLQPDTAGNGPAEVTLVEVQQAPENADLRPRCAHPVASKRPWFLFSVAGIGKPLRDAVRFCVYHPFCNEWNEVKPGVHQLLQAPHLRFMASDLRRKARGGAFFSVRLNVDRDARGLVPFLVRRTSARTNALGFRRTAPGQFDLAVNFGRQAAGDAEYLIYFVSLGDSIGRQGGTQSN